MHTTVTPPSMSRMKWLIKRQLRRELHRRGYFSPSLYFSYSILCFEGHWVADGTVTGRIESRTTRAEYEVFGLYEARKSIGRPHWVLKSFWLELSSHPDEPLLFGTTRLELSFP